MIYHDIPVYSNSVWALTNEVTKPLRVPNLEAFGGRSTYPTWEGEWIHVHQKVFSQQE